VTGLTLAGHTGYEPREMVAASSLDVCLWKAFREAAAARSAATVYLSEGRTAR